MAKDMIEKRHEQHKITSRGLSVKDVTDKVGGRKIYIWGAGKYGTGLMMALERNDIPVEGFLDISPFFANKKYRDKQVIHPDHLFEDREKFNDCFIFLGSNLRRIAKQMAAILEDKTRSTDAKGVEWISFNKVSPFYPSIDIAGVCNLRCIACPRGSTLKNMGKAGFMSAEVYKKVIDKLIREIPFVSMVDLYIWGDPALNPDIGEIIRINNNYGIASGVSTNLNYGKHIEDIVKAAPASILVATSGFGPQNYEVTHSGGKWEKFYKNLIKLRDYQTQYHSAAVITVYFHANKINLDDYKQVYELCKDLNFRLIVVPSTIFPNLAMDFVEKKEMCENSKKALEIQFVDMDEQLKFAQRNRGGFCTIRLAMPSIAWDTSLFVCPQYLEKLTAKSFLDISLEEIIDLHNNSSLCQKCIDYSLHRFYDLSYYKEAVMKKLFELHGLPDFI